MSVCPSTTGGRKLYDLGDSDGFYDCAITSGYKFEAIADPRCVAFEQAFMLVHDRYKDMNYLDPERERESTQHLLRQFQAGRAMTIVASNAEGSVVGAITGVLDHKETGLPSDLGHPALQASIGALRLEPKVGRRLVELTRFCVRKEEQDKCFVRLTLLANIFGWAKTKNPVYLLQGSNPKRKKGWMNIFGFKKIYRVEESCRANGNAEVLMLFKMADEHLVVKKARQHSLGRALLVEYVAGGGVLFA